MIGDDGAAPQVEHADAWRLGMLAALVTATATVAVVLVVAPGDDHAAGIALARAVIAGVPAGVAVYAWTSRRAPAGALLALLGAGSVVAALAEADHAVPYDAGRVAGWLVELLIVYVCLAYPGARLRTTADRVVFAVAVLVFAVL